ncbi:MAG TPA: D-alanyl-D-alanine carboxypeptidase family protein [Alphaproteobacteria bacterium]|nr:D-alanyl-D-alanine carboxypeptidase family protein [Alphaproteobacteria bacterium]
MARLGLLVAIFALLAGPAAAAPRLVLDAASGAVLLAEEADRPWYPASLTKMMTAYLVLAELRGGRMAADEVLKVSPHAAAQPPTELGLRAGATITVRDALAALIVRSANDAAVVLAERVAGTEPDFARRMTQAARDIGLRSTVFRNASGLPDPEQVTTARDMAKLAAALWRDFPEHRALFGLRELAWKGRSLPTYNGILVSYPGADGFKTGFTCAAGYNLVATAERDGRRLIGVVLGAPSRPERAAAMTNLLNRGFSGALPAVAKPGRKRSGPLAAPASWRRPPTVLDAETCAARGTDEETAGRTVAASNNPGHGVVLGHFQTEHLARLVLLRGKAQLGSDKGGLATVVRRKTAGKPPFQPIIVGLSADSATALCNKLRLAGGYCVVMKPAGIKAARPG